LDSILSQGQLREYSLYKIQPPKNIAALIRKNVQFRIRLCLANKVSCRRPLSGSIHRTNDSYRATNMANITNYNDTLAPNRPYSLHYPKEAVVTTSLRCPLNSVKRPYPQGNHKKEKLPTYNAAKACFATGATNVHHVEWIMGIPCSFRPMTLCNRNGIAMSVHRGPRQQWPLASSTVLGAAIKTDNQFPKRPQPLKWRKQF